MHISDASRDYIKNLDDYYAAGDIIRASIIDAKTYPLQLECKRNDLGVIYTTCIKCGSHVTKIKKNLLKCDECGWKQSRATTIDYGNVSFMPKY
jgi:exosome complex RNA-binding protein Csl4